MTNADIRSLIDFAINTAVPLGLEVTVKKLPDGRLGLAYGATLTADPERAFTDFQSYAADRMQEIEEQVDHESWLRDRADRDAQLQAEADDAFDRRHGL